MIYKQKRQGEAIPQGVKGTTYAENSNATVLQEQWLTILSPDASKAATVFLYNVGILSLDECQGRFDAHPEWRNA